MSLLSAVYFTRILKDNFAAGAIAIKRIDSASPEMCLTYQS